jgi:Insertion element 4 transposase N-terminal/Transposase DDE domain
VLADVVDRDSIEDVLIETGRLEKRKRLLPAHVMVRFCQAMTLFSDDDYGEVMCKLVEGLRDMRSWSESWELPSTAAITKARQRLGWEPMRELFDRCAVPVAQRGTKGAWLGNRRLMAIDGFVLDIPDTKENTGEFGRHSGAAFPQARVVALAECGSHAITAASVGGVQTGEQVLAAEITGFVSHDMLVIADRNFYGFDLWRRYRDTGADLLWRVKANLRLPVLKVLPDGSYLSLVADSAMSAKRRQLLLDAASHGEHIDAPDAEIVRVVEYDIPDRDGNGTGELVCLITSILDPAEATATDLAASYHERWEAENIFDELKTHQRGPARILRSQSPDMVKQEIWAYLLTHYSIRKLMCRVADEADVDPDRIAFTRALRIIRRQVARPADFSP